MASMEKGSFGSRTSFLWICPSVYCREQRLVGVCPLLFPPVHSTNSKCNHCGGTSLCPPHLSFSHPPEATCSWSEGCGVSQEDYGCSNATFPGCLCWMQLFEQKPLFSTKKKSPQPVLLEVSHPSGGPFPFAFILSHHSLSDSSVQWISLSFWEGIIVLTVLWSAMWEWGKADSMTTTRTKSVSVEERHVCVASQGELPVIV